MKALSVPPTEADHVLGKLDAALVIVEYGDYDCPHTRRAHANLKQLIEQSEASIALVFRAFPLRHMHENAQKLAELMQAIQPAEKFWAAHERMMAERRMSLEVAERVLGELGLSTAELSRQSEQAALAVQTQVDAGLTDGVHSTPSFFFNGAPHDGHYDVDTLHAQISDALRRSG